MAGRRPLRNDCRHTEDNHEQHAAIHAAPGASIETSTVVLRRLDTANLSVDGLERRSLGGYDQHGGYNPYDRVGRDYFAR